MRASYQSVNELATAIGKHVQQLLANTGAGASVSDELQAEPDKQGKRQLVLKVHTGKQIVNGADVQLSIVV